MYYGVKAQGRSCNGASKALQTDSVGAGLAGRVEGVGETLWNLRDVILAWSGRCRQGRTDTY
jgi:hypothetical protein